MLGILYTKLHLFLVVTLCAVSVTCWQEEARAMTRILKSEPAIVIMAFGTTTKAQVPFDFFAVQLPGSYSTPAEEVNIANEFQKMLKDHGMVSNMSWKGDCWEQSGLPVGYNAVAESFFGSFETERFFFGDYMTRPSPLDRMVCFS